MTRFISPPKSDLSKLRQPLTAGEKRVFEFFDEKLAPEWEIYLQPHLNGLKPDIVLLNPQVGIAVFEIKDWDLNAVNYRVEKQNKGAPILLGCKDGKEFSIQKSNPIEQVYRYKNEIMELYCPRLQKKVGYALITSGVIFPFASEQEVKAIFSESIKYRNAEEFSKYFPVVGRDSLISGNLESVFPEGTRKFSQLMSQDQYLDLKNWLIEPDADQEQREPLILDVRQNELAMSRTDSGYKRIRGSAGSGKSLILAARAAQLISEGKQVLVVTFNITLLHYLMDLTVRWPVGSGNTRHDITWLNFHLWCKRICLDTGHSTEYESLWQGMDPNEVLTNTLPDLVNSILHESDFDSIERYDAVLVDEGQDFLPHWWAALRKVCKPRGEMLLVADATQDIYETAGSWTDDAMKGAGFSGRWNELEVSYRLPKVVMDTARDFAEQFLPDGTINIPKTDPAIMRLFEEPCDLRWVHTNEVSAAKVCTDEILRIHTAHDNHALAFSDTTLLCDKKETGYEIVKQLGQKRIRCVHTFDKDDQESRRQKMSFYKGDTRVKATTLHSFKGWEGRAIVVCIGNNMDQKSLALLYTGITRVKRHLDGSRLTIVSSAKGLFDFGKTWPDFEEVYV